MAKKRSSRGVSRAPYVCELIAWRDHAEATNKEPWDKPTPPFDLYPHVVFSAGFVVSESPGDSGIVELARDVSEHGAISAVLHILKREIVFRKRVLVPRVTRAGLFRV